MDLQTVKYEINHIKNMRGKPNTMTLFDAEEILEKNGIYITVNPWARANPNTTEIYHVEKYCVTFSILLTEEDVIHLAQKVVEGCGCVPGEYMCPTAVRLWENVNMAYRTKNWEEYDKVHREYKNHVKNIVGSE